MRESKAVPLPLKDAERYGLRQGDFLIVRGNGSKRLVGQIALCQVDAPSVIFPDLMIRVRPNSAILDERYLLHFWQSPQMRDQIESSARSTAGIWKINQEDLLSWHVAYPKDKLEQKAIIRSLERLARPINELDEAQYSVEVELSALRRSVLDKAFRGEL